MKAFEFNRALVQKYDRPGPRYTSYPTAPQFHSAFALDDYRQAVAASNHGAAPKALSVYIHIPFCHRHAAHHQLPLGQQLHPIVLDMQQTIRHLLIQL